VRAWARRQLWARADHRRAGAHKMACDLELGRQLAPTAISGGGGTELRHYGRGGQVYDYVVSFVQHPRTFRLNAVSPGDFLGRMHRADTTWFLGRRASRGVRD
jgi:hypothetical protein